jgi:translation initiation factor IF-2
MASFMANNAKQKKPPIGKTNPTATGTKDDTTDNQSPPFNPGPMAPPTTDRQKPAYPSIAEQNKAAMGNPSGSGSGRMTLEQRRANRPGGPVGGPPQMTTWPGQLTPGGPGRKPYDPSGEGPRPAWDRDQMPGPWNPRDPNKSGGKPPQPGQIKPYPPYQLNNGGGQMGGDSGFLQGPGSIKPEDMMYGRTPEQFLQQQGVVGQIGANSTPGMMTPNGPQIQGQADPSVQLSQSGGNMQPGQQMGNFRGQVNGQPGVVQRPYTPGDPNAIQALGSPQQQMDQQGPMTPQQLQNARGQGQPQQDPQWLQNRMRRNPGGGGQRGNPAAGMQMPGSNPGSQGPASGMTPAQSAMWAFGGNAENGWQPQGNFPGRPQGPMGGGQGQFGQGQFNPQAVLQQMQGQYGQF